MKERIYSECACSVVGRVPGLHGGECGSRQAGSMALEQEVREEEREGDAMRTGSARASATSKFPQ